MKDTIAIMVPIRDMTDVLPRMYETVLNQTYKDWIAYLIDAKASTENVKEVVDDLNKKHGERIVYFKQQGDGITGFALNELWDQIKNNGHKYFATLAADDMWHYQKLEIQRYLADKKNGDYEPLLLTSDFMTPLNIDKDMKQLNMVINCSPVYRDFYVGFETNYELFSTYFFNDIAMKNKYDITDGKFTNIYAPRLLDWEMLLEFQSVGTRLIRILFTLAMNDINHTKSFGNMVRSSPNERHQCQVETKILESKYGY